ncbi:sterol desaturase family protein [Stigmatella erecta]|uniref:Fatty acid hydroxylase superfamily protein n=1 Tax=Stigmatella erecta TaxID=83460 RepID=A0A1I0L9Q8_9BACT|nr:sterol desaturase family protein [Stigmatella erecta]SEU36108.1 Fatty acid hydroxylase superfamily protein [Stigmatella erecta]
MKNDEYTRHVTGRMFDNAFLEFCSRIHPATPAILYLPLVVGLMGWGLWSGTTRPLLAAEGFAAGALTWFLLEYVIHRYVFHWEGKGRLAKQFHFIAHGYHHQYPDDPHRLVMPLGVSIPLATLIGAGLWAVGKPSVTLPYYCGIVAAYLFYDITHWALHFLKPRTAWGKALRAHHMAHHFACPDRNFGISNRWIDFVMGSVRRRDAAEDRA